MKKTLVLLGIVASVVVPFSAQADTESLRSGDNISHASTKTHKTATAARVRSDHQVTYITNKSVTGSHLPLVVSRYNGRYDSNSPLSVYGRPDLDRTGQLNVQSELYQRDPAISSVGMARR